MNVTRLPRCCVRRLVSVAVSLPLLAAAAGAALAQGEVNIYSYREPQLIDPLLKAFTDKTGIKANVVFAAAGLNERLAAEGQNSPADLLFTVDAGRLSEAKDAGLTQPVDSGALKAAIPAQFRDPAAPLVRAHHALARGLRFQGARASRTRSPTRSWPIPSGRASCASAPASTSTIRR